MRSRLGILLAIGLATVVMVSPSAIAHAQENDAASPTVEESPPEGTTPNDGTTDVDTSESPPTDDQATSTSATSTTATSTPATSTPSPSTTFLDRDQSYWAAILALVFGLVAIVVVLVFLWHDRTRSFKLMESISQRGAFEPVDQKALVEEMAARPTGLEAPAETPTPTLVGPTQLVAKEEASFVALHMPGTPTWTVTGEATLSSTTGASVRVLANVPGAIHLKVTADSAVVERDVVVVSPPDGSARSRVPILGAGFGTVIIALTVASATVALGLSGVLNGQAVAGILGSLVTYSIAKASGVGDRDGDVS